LMRAYPEIEGKFGPGSSFYSEDLG
jgi:hypothetical protein